ncbi:flagellar motor protein MotB [Cohnella fermenti]|uniref:Flagellar motor protein MotB n=1 Tax=Cohnella fermenti TaxID=2565925 RepID=A0A4S4BQ72_9BACL|nr:flagellar motor protein MotB [Cohnella fermenti]THF77070.1 flagellar motor protein MotB [Cohnella fermenti]
MSRRNRHEEHEEHADESWLLPYSDLMTLLLALFIVLYAASSINISKLDQLSEAFNSAFSAGLGVLDKSALIESDDEASKSQKQRHEELGLKVEQEKLKQQEQENLEKLKKELDQYIKKNGLVTQLETQLNQSQLMITIRDNALFASGSAAVKPSAQQLAVAIGVMLQKYPDFEILVSGHTDNQPINTREFANNWELSSQRALNFMQVLLQNSSFDPKNFSFIGYGEYRPVDTNDTEAGRAKNRRVEVSILRKYTDNSATDTVVSAISEDLNAPAASAATTTAN